MMLLFPEPYGPVSAILFTFGSVVAKSKASEYTPSLSAWSVGAKFTNFAFATAGATNTFQEGTETSERASQPIC